MLAAVAATTTNISYGSCIYMAAIKLLSSFSIASSNVQYAYGYSKGVHREEEEEEEPSEQFYWLYHISSVGEWLFTIDQSRKKKGRETEKEEEEKEERREGRVSNPLYLIHTYKQTNRQTHALKRILTTCGTTPYADTVQVQHKVLSDLLARTYLQHRLLGCVSSVYVHTLR